MMKYSKCLKNEYWMYNQVYKIYKNKEKTIEHLFEANGRTFQIEWQLKLLEEDIQGNILHVFFKTNKLKDFLINTPIKDYNNFLQFLIDNGTLKEMTNLNTGKDLLCSIYQICIHIPDEEYGYTYSLSVDEESKIRIILLHNNLVITMDKEKNKPCTLENAKTIEEQEDYEAWKLIINLIYYMKAFPECVIEGLPKGCKLDYSFKNKKIQLGISEKIVERTIRSKDGREIMPQIRSGHFRYLGSDYFTKKKGQVIFIDSCFVKGKNAKTVIQNNSIKKAEGL